MSEKLKVSIKINCPSCGKKGDLRIEKNIVAKNESGITAVNVATNLICEHSFVAYIDKNLAIRDCFTCDFKITLPDFKSKEKVSHKLEVTFDVDIIKINFIPSLMMHVLKGIFHGKKIALIIDQDIIAQGILQFYAYILENTFDSNIECINRLEYKKNKKLYKDFLVLDNLNVLHDNDKIITKGKLKIVNILVQKFYSEYNPQSSLGLIKNEADKAHILSKSIKKFIESLGLKKNDKIDTITIKNHINEQYLIDIDTDYLNFLIEIVKLYFKTDVPIVYKNLMGFF